MSGESEMTEQEDRRASDWIVAVGRRLGPWLVLGSMPFLLPSAEHRLWLKAEGQEELLRLLGIAPWVVMGACVIVIYVRWLFGPLAESVGFGPVDPPSPPSPPRARRRIALRLVSSSDDVHGSHD